MRRPPLFPPASFLVASIVVASCALPRAAQAQAYEVLHAFEQAPRDLRSELCLKDGDLYGVTLQGGVYDEGTIFKASADGTIEVLHSFGGPGTSEPWLPWGGLVWVPAAGAFFGTTWLGGDQDAGTVFRMQPGDPPEYFHHFQRGSDGRSPESTLVAASDGFVYGTTSADGSSGLGTLFRFDPANPAATFQTFYSFGSARGWQDEITQGPDGLYVAPPYCTSSACSGEVYKISTGPTPPSVTRIAEISTLSESLGEPVGVVASTQALYVTTTRSYAIPGAVIRISLSDGSKQVIHRFSFEGSGGHDPSSALVLESESLESGTWVTRLVGTTSLGGANGVGTAFRLTVREDTGVVMSYEKIDDFERPREGQGPRSTLVRAPSGEYYGATGAGAIGERGSVFRLDTSLAPIALIGRPRPGLVGSSPAGLTEGPNAGQLLGVTWEGGDGGQGTAFTFDPTTSSSPSVVAPFEGEATTTFGTLGLQASRPVRVGRDYYATLRQGGVNNQGAIVRISTDGTVATVHSFDAATEGYQPQELVPGPDGRLYGALPSGWYHGGAIFAFDPGTGGVEVLWSFSPSNETGGWQPMGRLVFDAAGVLYGVTNVGGVGHNGTVFSLRRSAAAWEHTVLRRLVGGTDGSRPIAGLVLASDGRLYGTTGGVGYGAVPPSQLGTVFRINRDGSGFELLHTFTGDTDSCTPAATLVEAPDGWLYGTAYGGYFCQQMPGWWGSLFRVRPQTGAFETLHTFDRVTGANPWASLLPTLDGSLIGSGTYGGPQGGGVLFRIVPPRVEDSIGALIEEVRELIGPPGPLNSGQGNSLISKLQGALDQLARGNVTPAINKLEAFVNEVEAYIRSGKLTEAQGRPLVLAAQSVIAALR